MIPSGCSVKNHPALGRGRHRVVGGRVGDLVVRPVAELGVAVAAVGRRRLGLVVRAAGQQQPETGDQDEEPAHEDSVASGQQRAQRQRADRQPVPVVVGEHRAQPRVLAAVLDPLRRDSCLGGEIGDGRLPRGELVRRADVAVLGSTRAAAAPRSARSRNPNGASTSYGTRTGRLRSRFWR